jgi:hypothetical protein
MSTEVHQDSLEPHEEQLCTSCTAPNAPSADFCVKCGAPLSSFSFIDPFKGPFAEGIIYSQVADHPRSLITVFGIWLIFGAMAVAALMIMVIGFQDPGSSLAGTIGRVFFGVAIILVRCNI